MTEYQIELMTEYQIELTVECTMNAFDRQLLAGVMTQEDYDAHVKRLDDWAERQFQHAA